LDSTIPALLAGWQSYYVIIGSSAGALIGLQFVVMALIADAPMSLKSPEDGVAAFGSPIVVHFCSALLLSAFLSAPWSSGAAVATMLDACGAAGIAYVAIVARRARRQSGYHMTHEDWRWHVFAPLIAYATFLAAGLALPAHPAAALFVAAVAPAALLYIGIRNAWDTVTYVVVDRARARDGDPAE
jgi:hypothetical protein